MQSIKETNRRISVLEKMLKSKNADEEKYRPQFEKYASYLGNGVYSWMGHLSTDTRELFLLGCCTREKIEFNSERL